MRIIDVEAVIIGPKYSRWDVHADHDGKAIGASGQTLGEALKIFEAEHGVKPFIDKHIPRCMTPLQYLEAYPISAQKIIK